MDLFRRLNKRREDGDMPGVSGVSPGSVGVEMILSDTPQVEMLEVPPLPPPREAHIHLAPSSTLEELLARLVAENGSDLLLSVGSRPAFRVHGTLHFAISDALTQEAAGEILLGLLSEDDRYEFHRRGSRDLVVEVNGLGRFRCNMFRQHHGLAAAFHVIPSQLPDIDTLELPAILKKIAAAQSGLIIVTGPYGSGRTTTLAAMIAFINQHRQTHIVTVEDPVEYVHFCHQSLIDHREVGSHASSFADALTASMREDPDIVVISEMRDEETIYAALRAAESGILVFTTFHAASTTKTIERLVDVFPNAQQPQIRALLGEQLRAVIAQNLLPRLDGEGQVAVHEILISDAGLTNLIRDGKVSQIPNFITMGSQPGMQTLDRGLLDLLDRKLIHPLTASRYCQDATSFKAHGYDLEALRV